VPHFKAVYLREQGQDMVIIPLESSFGNKSEADQRDIIEDLQRHSVESGLKGTVVPVWASGGRMHFTAPQPWRPFFTSISLHRIWASINKGISW
jgi:hypothetical protein